MENIDFDKMDPEMLETTAQLLVEPYNYLLQVMIYSKEAIKNGGSVDIISIPDLWNMTTVEGEMFHKDLLTRFGTLENYDYNGELCDIDDCLPVTFTPNAKGLQLGQIGLELERLVKDELPSKIEIMNLSIKRYKELEARLKDIPKE